MVRDEKAEEELLRILRTVAPGTPLREGLENILRAGSGALIVVGDRPEVMEIAEGGFRVNAEFSPAKLYELAKMDGAIILDDEARRIIAANTQLVPDLGIPSNETGIRHRTAERVARQTDALVISISQRRGVITMYKGSIKYVLRDLGVIFTKANQALQTLEKYRTILDRILINLSIQEFEDTVTLYDVCKIIQRIEMTLKVVREIGKYITELGTEGRLITMQLDELIANLDDEGLLVIQDYSTAADRTPRQLLGIIESWPSEDLLDLPLIARVLGYPGGSTILEQHVSSRGYRILGKIPRLPSPVIENLVGTFGTLNRCLNASLEELDAVEGIGETRARAIKEGLSRYWNQLLQERYR
ncbi:MAG: DNA integrity scanning diadenylate cyclase DisA [Thermoanaerobacterales bacterium]|nr:DNA integrity scanning diadenylate cyclase DisA [Bacillota bacterium]MDI6907547.1 DNA integrity scanning diadenylate cyclase DisA [Thermoanaerobacterales bacterium]